jgi:hypothetical protein
MEQNGTNAARSTSAAFFSLIKNPFTFRMFLMRNLPAAYFSGVRVRSFDEGHCAVTVPYKWFTRNPFRSTYFACMSMAAEMSTGVLAMGCVYKRKPKVSLLVIAVEGKFYKKATDVTKFICEEGTLIRDVVELAISSGEPQSIRVHTKGFNREKELVSEFWITWSFRSGKS